MGGDICVVVSGPLHEGVLELNRGPDEVVAENVTDRVLAAPRAGRTPLASFILVLQQSDYLGWVVLRVVRETFALGSSEFGMKSEEIDEMVAIVLSFLQTHACFRTRRLHSFDVSELGQLVSCAAASDKTIDTFDRDVLALAEFSRDQGLRRRTACLEPRRSVRRENLLGGLEARELRLGLLTEVMFHFSGLLPSWPPMRGDERKMRF